MSCAPCLVCHGAVAGNIVPAAVRICPALWVGRGRRGAPPKSPSNIARGRGKCGEVEGQCQLALAAADGMPKSSAGLEFMQAAALWCGQSFTDDILFAGFGCRLKRRNLGCYELLLFCHPLTDYLFLCPQKFHQWALLFGAGLTFRCGQLSLAIRDPVICGPFYGSFPAVV